MGSVLAWNAGTLPVPARAEYEAVAEDDDLVSRARAGDQRAFELLFERYQAPILNYLHRMVGDRSVAEDLTQESFIKAYRAIGETDRELHFRAWLYRIATNTAISHLRRQKIVRFMPFLSGFDHPSNESVEGTASNRHDVEQTLRKIPQHYAAALLLRHYQGLSLAETATALGITETACKLRLFRARKAFAAAYGGPAATDPEIAGALGGRE